MKKHLVPPQTCGALHTVHNVRGWSDGPAQERGRERRSKKAADLVLRKTSTVLCGSRDGMLVGGEPSRTCFGPYLKGQKNLTSVDFVTSHSGRLKSMWNPVGGYYGQTPLSHFLEKFKRDIWNYKTEILLIIIIIIIIIIAIIIIIPFLSVKEPKGTVHGQKQ